ncbi:MAG: hypothetical protein JNM84_24730 [Planctomycetes bacterium]|nr:hypothetical protein [Planctomycetota bacterium]
MPQLWCARLRRRGALFSPALATVAPFRPALVTVALFRPALVTVAPFALALVVAALGAACRSTDPALYDAERRPLVERERASYRLAVAPFAFETEVRRATAERPLALRSDEASLTSRLRHELEQLGSAAEVVEVRTRSFRDVPRDAADLLLVPTLRSASFELRGATGGAGLEFVAWYVTWIGGHFVEDYDYVADLRVGAELVRVEDGTVLDRFEYSTADEGPMTLSFYDRNEAFEAGFFTTLILPPFLTADDDEVLVDSLTQRAMQRLAARVKRGLVDELPDKEEADLARVEWLEPASGTRITGERVLVRFAVRAKRRINEVLLFVDDALEPSFAVPARDLADAYRGGVFSLRWATELALDPERGRHRVRLDLVDADGRATRRSVVLER